MNVKFGLIGHGFMGTNHVKTLTNLAGAELIGVCDIDPQQLTGVPKHIKTYTDAADMLKDPAIDAVVIAANNDQHRKLVEAVAAAGKHVLCEKPVALSLEDLDAMEACCKSNNVTFTVHQQRRYDPDFRKTKAVFDSETLGTPYTVKTSLYGFNGNMHDWHVYADQGGGMLYDWGVHLIDQMLWMIPGNITTIYADLRNVINKEVDDYFHIMLRFESGIVAHIELGTYFLKDQPGWFERHWFIGGNKGSMYVDGFHPTGAIVRTTQLLQSVGNQRTMTAAGPTRSFGPPPEGRIVREELPEADVNHKMYFENYLAALRGDEEFLVTIPQVRRVLKVMDAVRQSAASGKSVDFQG